MTLGLTLILIVLVVAIAAVGLILWLFWPDEWWRKQRAGSGDMDPIDVENFKRKHHQ